MSVPVSADVIGILVKLGFAIAACLIVQVVFVPAVRQAMGRGRRRRSTLDRLERSADEQPAVRITIADAGVSRIIEPVRLVGTRAGDAGASLLECIHDDGRTLWIDASLIIAIEELPCTTRS